MPFWRQLTRIGQTAAALGEGDFAVRAKIPSIAALAPLANTFNLMAERIQQLITAQKELTNAVFHELRTPIARLRFGMAMVGPQTLRQNPAISRASTGISSSLMAWSANCSPMPGSTGPLRICSCRRERSCPGWRRP